MDDPQQVANPLERRARLAAETMDAIGRRVAASMDAPPADARKLTPAEAREAYFFTPYPDGAAAYWQKHDALLAEYGARADMQDPQQALAVQRAAEVEALRAAYPYRAMLAEVGSADIGRQLEKAQRLLRLAVGQALEETPEAGDLLRADSPSPQEEESS